MEGDCRHGSGTGTLVPKRDASTAGLAPSSEVRGSLMLVEREGMLRWNTPQRLGETRRTWADRKRFPTIRQTAARTHRGEWPVWHGGTRWFPWNGSPRATQ